MDELKKMLKEYKEDLLKDWKDANLPTLNKLEALELRITDMETKFKERWVIPGLEGPEKKVFSFFKAVYAIRTNDWTAAGYEKEVFDATRKKAQSMGTATAGGYIVPTIYVAELIELLSAQSVVSKMGATFLSDLQGSPIQIPRQTGGSTAYWVGENADITESAITLDQLSLTPKKVAALIKLSNTLIKLSNPSAEALVRRDLARVLALKIDSAALRGTGGSGQPIGINTTSSINTVTIGASGGSLTWDYLLDMEYALAASNALQGKLGFIFHPVIRRNLLKKKVAQYSTDTAGEYMIQPVGNETNFQAWLGYPYAMTTQIPINLEKLSSGATLTEVYFGNWEELLIGQWGGMEIRASEDAYDAFQKDQTWVRILQEVDLAVRHPESFCLISDASATS